jgi:hypothetical protein
VVFVPNNNLKFEDYNGWTNRDTWLVALWLDNDRNNYERVVRVVNGVGRAKKLADYTDLELWEKLKDTRLFKYGDEINWNNVNIQEIRERLEEYVGLEVR